MTASPKTHRTRPLPERGARAKPVDLCVGRRIRQRRLEQGLTQDALAEAVGLTFQQIQKYERGANRVGASRLWDLACVLGCPMEYFFVDAEDATHAAGMPAPPSVKDTVHDAHGVVHGDPMGRQETLDLVRVYYKIANPNIRRRVYELTRSMAQIDEPEK